VFISSIKITLNVQQRALGKISFTSDIWSDPNLVPYDAITAHWIQTTPVKTPHGEQLQLTLQADLIAFIHLPGHHTGEHLKEVFVYAVDRLGIAHKVRVSLSVFSWVTLSKSGHITMDSASNNDTFARELEEEFVKRGIEWGAAQNRIRLVTMLVQLFTHQGIRCCPHVVNIATRAVLDKVTDLSLAKPYAEYDGSTSDPIASIRALVGAVCFISPGYHLSDILQIRKSSLRRQYFQKCLETLKQGDLQLLRDVETRWSSTLLMSDRALLSRAVSFTIGFHFMR
jgi:hypothetical protein